MQRLRPLRTRPRTHADRNLAVVRFGGGGQREGRLYEVQRAQAARTALKAAPATASFPCQLAVSTQSGYLIGQFERRQAVIEKFSR